MYVTNSQYYKEGLKHLDKDIDSFSKRFDGLKEEVRRLNEKPKKFQKEDIYKIVTSYFLDNDFKVDDNHYPTVYPYDTVFTKLLTDDLKSYWYKKNDFYLPIPSSDELRFNGKQLIAKVSDNKRQVLIQHVYCLKQYHPILREYDIVLEEYNRIVEESNRLSKEINEKVVSKITIGDYKTTCNQCGWFNFLHIKKKQDSAVSHVP